MPELDGHVVGSVGTSGVFEPWLNRFSGPECAIGSVLVRQSRAGSGAVSLSAMSTTTVPTGALASEIEYLSSCSVTGCSELAGSPQPSSTRLLLSGFSDVGSSAVTSTPGVSLS